MMTIIILFYISLLGMIYMIFLKSGEMNSGRRNILSRLGSGADHIFQSAFQSVGQGISYINKHTFIALAHWLAYHVLVRVRNVYVEIKHYVLPDGFNYNRRLGSAFFFCSWFFFLICLLFYELYLF